MIQNTRRMLGQLRQNNGFTLVEMALVLIIIGIIIGAIVKGNDLVRSAEQKRIYSKFLSDWRLAYMNFYDRTGKILGDTYNTADATTGQDGRADTSAATSSSPTEAGQGGLSTSTSTTVYLGLTDVGLRAPTTNITDTAYQYRYVDSEGNSHILDIAFAWDATDNYNYMRITNMPGELAIAIDTMVDGQANGQSGDFIAATGDGSANLTDFPAATVDTTEIRWKMQF